MTIERALILLSYVTNIVVVIGWGITIFNKARLRNSITRFYGKKDVIIYLPSRFVESINRLTTSNEDFYAATEIAQFLNKHNISTRFVHIKSNDIITPSVNSIFICGPKSNQHLHNSMSYDPNFSFIYQSEEWILYDKKNNYELVSPMDKTPRQDRDLSYINSFKINTLQIVIIAGLHSIGSKGAASFLTNEEKLKKLLKDANGKNFSTILISKFNNQTQVIEETSVFIPVQQY